MDQNIVTYNKSLIEIQVYFLPLNITGQWGYCNICQDIQEAPDPPPVTVRPTLSAGVNTIGVKPGDWLPDPNKAECGQNGIGELFFVTGGSMAGPGQFPFMALIGYKVRVSVGIIQ